MSPATLFLDLCAVAAGLVVILITLGLIAFAAVCVIGSLTRRTGQS